MSPDEALFREHLESSIFLAGVRRGRWKLQGEPKSIIWPHPIFWIEAAKRFISNGGLFLHFDLQGYPQAPTACPWNIETAAPLEPSLWPRGMGNVSRVFNPNWNRSALYAPCDRMAMVNHEAWKTKHSAWWWNSKFTFVRYLEFVHLCLNPYGNEREDA